MEGLSGSKSFPPGFRFHPTDEELFMFYLKRKVLGKSLGTQMISELDVYRFAPWDLPAMACVKTKDLNWYFFCPRVKRYPNGCRANRATEWGYWKSTGNDRTVMYASRAVGKIKTLVFYRGKAPKGERTNWVMHEFRLEDKMLADKGVPQDSYVICRLFEKSGLGPKNGEDYGARFVEEEWDSDTDDNYVRERDSGHVLHGTGCGCAADSPNDSVITLSVGAPKVFSPVGTPVVAVATNVASPRTIAASVGAPYITTTSMGIPYSNATSARVTPNTDPVSMDAPNVIATSMGSASPPTTMGSASNAAALTEDEVDRLLKYFIEDAGDIGDIYNGLGDLADTSAQNTDWSNLSDTSTHNPDWCNQFIEMNDLI